MASVLEAQLASNTRPPEEFLTGAQALLDARTKKDSDTLAAACDFLFKDIATPLCSAPLSILVSFMNFRQPAGAFVLPEWQHRLYGRSHCLYENWSLETMQRIVRNHPPTHKSGDEYADSVADFIREAPKATKTQKRELFVASLLVMAVRSTSLLQFFKKEGLAMNRETITKLYNWHLDKQSVFPGLSLEKRSRQAHTSEQKLWSLGFLIDSFLVPYLLDETHFDENLSFEEKAPIRLHITLRVLQ